MDQNTNNGQVLYKKYGKMKMRWFLVPPLVFILTIVLWGLVALIGGRFQVFQIVNILVPILMGLEIILILAGVIVGIYYSIKQSEIKKSFKI